MRLLTLALYVLIGALLAAFAAINWTLVTLRLWGDYELVIRLPVLMIACFLVGLLPIAILQNVSRWRLGRKVRKLEAALVTASTPAPETPAPATSATAPSAAPPPPAL